jgi:hypothetical protein
MAKDLNIKDSKIPKNAIIRQKIEYEIAIQRVQQDLAKWRNATLAAENIINPYRIELYRLAKDILLDAHINAVWNARKSEILGNNFIVYKSGKIQDKQTDFLQRKWFFDFIDYAMDSKMWGFSLIQFGNIENNEFCDIDLVPRGYVRPEMNLVVPIFGALTGEDYTKSPYKEWILPIGEKLDLGLILKLGPLYIWKKTAMESWANYCQIFGVPSRVLKVDTTDIVALRNGQRMVKEMGSSLGAVIDKEDELEILEAKGSNVGETFIGLINLCNAEISKLVLGESSSMDPKSFVGSAKIHEKTKNQMILTDIVWLENIFKYQLIPFLNSHDLNFDGCSIEIEQDQQLTQQEKGDIIVKILPFYDIPPEYIMETFGIPTIYKLMPGQPAPIINSTVKTYLKEESSSAITSKEVTEDEGLDDTPIRENWTKEMEKESDTKNNS